MYQIDDTILYGADGVCRIAGFTEKNIGGKRLEYYVLKPVYNSATTIFAPVDSEALKSKMRRVLSAQEIHHLIASMPEEETIWVEDENERRARYREILARGERVELIQLIKTLYHHGEEQKERGKKLHLADDRFMKEAERMLYDEFAHVLELDREAVLPFILEHFEDMWGDAGTARG